MGPNGAKILVVLYGVIALQVNHISLIQATQYLIPLRLVEILHKVKNAHFNYTGLGECSITI